MFTRKKQEEKCGTCIYHRYDDRSQGYLCCNPESEYVAEWTDYEDVCDEYEERE